MKNIKIEIDLITLVALLLIIGGLFLGIVGYYVYNNNLCVADPVAYANNNSASYGYSFVIGIS